MSITLKNELDPVFETIMLLSLCHQEDWKEITIKELKNYRADAEEFFEKHIKTVEKYLQVFQKYRVHTSQEEFFFERAGSDNPIDGSVLVAVIMLIENRDILEAGGKLTPLEMRSILAFYIADTGDYEKLPEIEEMPQLPDEKAIIEFLDTAEVKNEEKWYVLDILRRPDYWIQKLYEMIEVNRPALLKALDAVEKPLQKMLRRFEGYKPDKFMRIADTYSSEAVIYTTLAMPFVQVLLYTRGYQGILMDYVDGCEAAAGSSKETVLRQMKALADKSKLDMLLVLKESSKYNLQMSETLGLSPSTTSHHLNALLESEFVTVQKKDGKVYYCLNQSAIERFLSGIKELLL